MDIVDKRQNFKRFKSNIDRKHINCMKYQLGICFLTVSILKITLLYGAFSSHVHALVPSNIIKRERGLINQQSESKYLMKSKEISNRLGFNLEQHSSTSLRQSESDTIEKSMNGDVGEQILNKLQGKLLKRLRQTALQYDMLEDGDHLMICVSGGKDSATLLYLLLQLQKKLRNVNFRLTAVHLNQMQPGYDGVSLVEWLEELKKDYSEPINGPDGSVSSFDYKIVTEDTYSIVLEKTDPGKTYCSMCSRLRRGILYTIAHDLGCNKIALGHHGNDAMETLFLNMIHAGQMKGMPARYYSEERDANVLRPLIHCLEKDIAQFARAMKFPILPCNLCGTQPDAQRAKVKLLCDTTLALLNPNAQKNIINSMGDIRPSHLLDTKLRQAVGMDQVTGRIIEDRALGYQYNAVETTSNSNSENVNSENEEIFSQSRIEQLL